MSEWVDYKEGDYEKKFYDIKLHSSLLDKATVFLGCWPNAGFFNAGDYGNFNESLVAQVRESKLNELGMPISEGIES